MSEREEFEALEKWLIDNDKTKLNEWRTHMVKEAFFGGFEAANKQSEDRIAEQLHTIKALNLCIGGSGSYTLENITHSGVRCKEDETLLDRLDREHNDNLGVLRLLAVERAKVEVLTQQLSDREGDLKFEFDRAEELDARALKYAMESNMQALRIGNLEEAITKTLNENLGLADGDNCTLIDLKKVMRIKYENTNTPS